MLISGPCIFLHFFFEDPANEGIPWIQDPTHLRGMRVLSSKQPSPEEGATVHGRGKHLYLISLRQIQGQRQNDMYWAPALCWVPCLPCTSSSSTLTLPDIWFYRQRNWSSEVEFPKATQLAHGRGLRPQGVPFQTRPKGPALWWLSQGLSSTVPSLPVTAGEAGVTDPAGPWGAQLHFRPWYILPAPVSRLAGCIRDSPKWKKKQKKKPLKQIDKQNNFR